MLAELLARFGQNFLRGIPPDGRAYWATRYWDRDAAEKHPVLADSFLQQKETVAKFLRRHGGHAERVLEFACGTGEFTRLAAESTPAKKITAVDISEQGLEIARRRVRHDDLELVLGDFWQDNKVGTADLVLCIDAIHHLGDIRSVLQRLKTFVDGDGVVIGNVWIADHFHEFQRRRYGRIRHLARTSFFFVTAAMIRLSGGHLRTGSYRTQLVHSEEVERILRELFGEVLETSTERYFMTFACKP
jgi:ubiquinone/menaquinone biosynthesis C-methylase UbiE